MLKNIFKNLSDWVFLRCALAFAIIVKQSSKANEGQQRPVKASKGQNNSQKNL